MTTNSQESLAVVLLQALYNDDKQLLDFCFYQKDSKLVEVSDDKTKLRRVGNKPLPIQTGSMRKRDSKAAGK